jgi:Arc/MetJ-type ribon-helix-helix transcriptional regulator
MEISLNPALQARIEEKLRNGEFSSADALVEQALTLFLESDEMDDAEFLAARFAVEQGLEEAKKGEDISLEEFDQMMRARHGISQAERL